MKFTEKLCPRRTDVEQEVNGLYTHDRKLKFPIEKIKAAITQEANLLK